ncbi:cysteine proteinase, partial [Meira miltonrushii]
GKIASIPGAGVESHDIQKLSPRQWLNDEVINFYLKMIERRTQRTKDLELIADVKKRWNGIWNVHVFNTFFYEKLVKQGYAGVRQWTRKVDIFTKDLILLPINLGQAHWVCAAINMRKLRFEYYDSMHSYNRKAFDVLSDYVHNEYNDKKKGEFGQLDLSGWKRYFSQQSPIQANGFDCGVFASMTIEQLSRRNDESDAEEEEEWNFSQDDMPYLRKRMVYEIATTN